MLILDFLGSFIFFCESSLVKLPIAVVKIAMPDTAALTEKRTTDSMPLGLAIAQRTRASTTPHHPASRNA